MAYKQAIFILTFTVLISLAAANSLGLATISPENASSANASSVNSTAPAAPSMQIFAHPQAAASSNSSNSTSNSSAVSTSAQNGSAVNIQATLLTTSPSTNPTTESILNTNAYLTSASWIFPGLLAIIELQQSTV